jgi:prepilin-type N-terminal cleavage/methylation domain-containing protein
MERRLRPIAGMRAAGFSLIEVVVAMAISMTGLAAVAHTIAASTRTTRLARSSSDATIAAEQKLESLRAAASSLDQSPSDALFSDTPGYCDYLDARGAPIDPAGVRPPAGTMFVRRWSVHPVPGSARETLVLQVVVAPWGEPPTGAAAVRLITVAARKAD